MYMYVSTFEVVFLSPSEQLGGGGLFNKPQTGLGGGGLATNLGTIGTGLGGTVCTCM